MNSKWHFYISITKSVIRLIGAGLSLMTWDMAYLCISIALAEVFGIVEEIGDER